MSAIMPTIEQDEDDLTLAYMAGFSGGCEVCRDTQAKYDELLYAVAKKYPGESRHDTALRYIRDRETVPGLDALAAAKGQP